MPLGLEVPMSPPALPAPAGGAAALMGGTPYGAIANMGAAALSKPPASSSATSGSKLEQTGNTHTAQSTKSNSFAFGLNQQTDRSVNFGSRGASNMDATQTPTSSATATSSATSGIPWWVWALAAGGAVVAYLIGKK